MGEKVCAAIVPAPGATPTLADVTAHCDRAGLAKFKWPERLEIVEALPRNALAKLDRKALAARLTPEPEGAGHG
jgi:non-ribosomal peptide synthetase component E (peptide arylation enzyme)